MIFTSSEYTVTIEELSAFSSDFSNNIYQHSKKYQLQDPGCYPSVIYGLTCHSNHSKNEKCVVFAGGGRGALTSRSVIIHESLCWLAAGDQVVCFEMPAFKMKWHKKCDAATCFEIFLAPDNSGIVVHGELEISKISFNGDCIWSASGKDIFTGDFWIDKNHIEATDFNDEKYLIDLKTGSITLG